MGLKTIHITNQRILTLTCELLEFLTTTQFIYCHGFVLMQRVTSKSEYTADTGAGNLLNASNACNASSPMPFAVKLSLRRSRTGENVRRSFSSSMPPDFSFHFQTTCDASTTPLRYLLDFRWEPSLRIYKKMRNSVRCP